MENLTVFNNDQFGEIRTLNENGEILFCGADIARALGYAKPQNAIATHCKGALKRGIPTLGGVQTMTFLKRGDVYRLITHSQLDSAERFESWVFDEVLPSIHDTGSYVDPKTSVPAVRMSDALLVMANVAKLAEENQRRLNAVEESQKELVGKLDKAAEAFTAPSFSPDTWQENARATIAAIVQENGLSYQAYTGELYKKLESVACVDLTSRQTFKRKRMKAEGATYRDREAVSKLSIIAADAKLRAIFDGVLREEKAKRLLKGA